jgi:RNA polymerase sigma-70 factor (ECF subfamily)
MTSTQRRPYPTDLELVDLSRQGDLNALGELLSRHYHKCANLASNILRDPASARDEVQKACLNAFQRLDQYRGTSDFSVWLSAIVVNQCRMLIRSRRRVPLLTLDEDEVDAQHMLAHAAQDPECELLTRELVKVVRHEVGRLPTPLRNIATICDIEGLPIADAAARLGITTAAAKARLVRARVEVRARVVRRVGARAHHVRSAVRSLPAKPRRPQPTT